MNRVKIINKKVFVITFISLFTGCSSHSPAPVIDIYSITTSSDIHKIKAPDTNVKPSNGKRIYIVKPGDTLFSIAWYHSLDHQELVNINNLKSNLIFPQQKLLLVRPTPTSFFEPQSLIASLNREVLKKPVSYPFANSNSHDTKRIKKYSIAKKSNKTKKNIKKTKNNSFNQKKDNQTKKYMNFETKHQGSLIAWIWPTDGKILNRFSTNLNANRGLDIAAKLGQPVRATAPGRVVYEGNGLKGYGNLVIIKHKNNYLSAYAHNHKIHVSENEFVNAGQRIADVGNSGTHTDKLHFEIRYKGKPVDPLNYLPKKSY